MFIVLVATIGALALSYTTQVGKQTSDIYLRTQAELLALSATEYAMLAISAHDIDAAGTCINRIDATHNNMFDINITLRYFGNDLPALHADCAVLDNTIATPDSNVTVMVDTVVTTRDNVGTERIRIHRRTLQKP
jgi:hypothetical protein